MTCKSSGCAFARGRLVPSYAASLQTRVIHLILVFVLPALNPLIILTPHQSKAQGNSGE
jgi:hypothetical protein